MARISRPNASNDVLLSNVTKLCVTYFVHCCRLPYVEEYVQYKDKWEVTITPGYDVIETKDCILKLTTLTSSELDVCEYESYEEGFVK